MKFNRLFRRGVQYPEVPTEYGEVDYGRIKKVLDDALAKDWGPRCATKDYEDFPEIKGDDPNKISRCHACEVYERYDRFWECFSPDEIS